jgi:hypothetical protein
MTENQPVTAARPANWKVILLRCAGVGGGFAIIAALVLGGIVWWSSRPKPWSSSAITAKPTQLGLQQAGDEVRFEFRYAFTNHTSEEYALPSPEMGALMRKLPKDGSFEKLDGATWDSTIKIPPNQSINISFLMPYKLADFNMMPPDLDLDNKLTAFAGRRLNQIDGLAFFDYTAKYKVEMPRNWDQPKESEKK